MKRLLFIVITLILFCFPITNVVFAEEIVDDTQPTKRISIAMDNEFLFERSYNYNSWMLDGSVSDFLLTNENNGVSYFVSLEAVCPLLARDIRILSEKYTYPAIDSVITKGDKEVYTSASFTGKEVNVNQFALLAAKALDEGAVFNLPYTSIAPSASKEDNDELITLLASFTTDYQSSSNERSHNIELAASFLNSLEIAPNEAVSFNEIVGSRSTERGFEMAPIILSGEFVLGVGGGVCQVSTTLYNAVALAGLEIITANQHSKLVSYVDPSRDAMVSTSSDFVFRNNSGSPIYLFADCIDKTVTFRLYGKRSPYVYQLETEIISQEVNDEGRIETYSEGYRLKYLDGKLVDKVKTRQDWYS